MSFKMPSLRSDSPSLPPHSIGQRESLSKAQTQEERTKDPILKEGISKNLLIYLKTTTNAKGERGEGRYGVLVDCHLGRMPGECLDKKVKRVNIWRRAVWLEQSVQEGE